MATYRPSDATAAAQTTTDLEKATRDSTSSLTQIEEVPAPRPTAGVIQGEEKRGQSNSDDPDEKIELSEEDCYDELGYSFPTWKKWTILTIIFLVQVSMNFNTSLYSNALGGISKQFGVSEQVARLGAAIYLITYAFGCELWAPWSEELGRKFLLHWLQLIFGVFVQIIHLWVPETRSTVMMDRIAKRWREEGKRKNVYGPNELLTFKERFSAKEILLTWVRPFRMFLTEPIVLVLSLLSGFSDALIFMFIQSFALVYKQWNFQPWAIGVTFCAIGLGYVVGWLSFFPAIRRNIKEREANPESEKAQYESRLWWLLYTAPCLPIGLIVFAWTSTGPPLHWIGSMVAAAIVGVANYAIYMATIDYMICAYGPYSASATGGNGWARDFLAGVLTLPATPFFENIGPKGKHIPYAATILSCISAVLVAAVYVIYWKGPVLRKRSPFAQQLSGARDNKDSGRKYSYVPASGARQASRSYSTASEYDTKRAGRSGSHRKSEK